MAIAAFAVSAVALGGTALAGVGGQPALQGNETNATTDGNATAGNATGNASAEALPPGVSESGVTNASELVAAHVDVASGIGYEFTFQQNYSVDAGENATLPPSLADTTAVQNGTVAEGLAPFRVHTETERDTGNDTTMSTVDYWGNETLVALRAQQADQTEFRTFQRDGNETRAGALGRPAFDSVVTKSRLVEGVLQSGSFEVAGTEQVDDRTLVTLRATEYQGTLGVAAENVTAYDATVTVDERGLIHGFEFALSSTTRSVPVQLNYSFELTQTDVNVTRPAWVSEALAAAGQQVSVGTQNGTYLTVTNAGDQPLRAGTTVTVARDAGEETVELSEPLAPGTTAFVAFPEGNATVSVGSPPDADAPALSGSYNVTVRSPDDQVVGQASFTFREVADGNATAGNATDGDVTDDDATDDNATADDVTVGNATDGNATGNETGA